MRAAAFARVATLCLVTGFAPVAEAELPSGRGVLLPLQDRVGEAEVTRFAENLLRRELGSQTSLAESEEVRAVLRSMRIRDASNESLDRLAVLGNRLGAEWFFIATLHEARAGRELQRQDGEPGSFDRSEDAGDTPQVVLSALVLRSDSPEIWWAGFDGVSGRDSERAFGLGEVETLEELVQNAVKELVGRAVGSQQGRSRTRLRSRKDGYLRSPSAPSPPETVAVIPMDSIASRDPSGSAGVVTAALFATLDDFGFQALLPGFVRTIRQESAQIQHGGASRPEWEALGREGGAVWVATGTVETYHRGQGRTPDPLVGFSVRFLDTGDGSVDWSNGLERAGGDTARVFDRGRIYSTGGLTYEMMRSLLGELPAGSKDGKKGRGN